MACSVALLVAPSELPPVLVGGLDRPQPQVRVSRAAVEPVAPEPEVRLRMTPDGWTR